MSKGLSDEPLRKVAEDLIEKSPEEQEKFINDITKHIKLSKELNEDIGKLHDHMCHHKHDNKIGCIAVMLLSKEKKGGGFLGLFSGQVKDALSKLFKDKWNLVSFLVAVIAIGLSSYYIRRRKKDTQAWKKVLGVGTGALIIIIGILLKKLYPNKPVEVPPIPPQEPDTNPVSPKLNSDEGEQPEFKYDPVSQWDSDKPDSRSSEPVPEPMINQSENDESEGLGLSNLFGDPSEAKSAHEEKSERKESNAVDINSVANDYNRAIPEHLRTAIINMRDVWSGNRQANNAERQVLNDLMDHLQYHNNEDGQEIDPALLVRINQILNRGQPAQADDSYHRFIPEAPSDRDYGGGNDKRVFLIAILVISLIFLFFIAVSQIVSINNSLKYRSKWSPIGANCPCSTRNGCHFSGRN